VPIADASLIYDLGSSRPIVKPSSRLTQIAAAYPALADGRVLLPFPRFFFIAVEA
jgi:hypothetical protein